MKKRNINSKCIKAPKSVQILADLLNEVTEANMHPEIETGQLAGQETLQIGKRDVDILSIEPVGNYAIKPTFSDGHDSGLYSWDVLHTLCVHRDELWQAYLDKLENEGGSRDPAQCPVPVPKPPAACGGGQR